MSSGSASRRSNESASSVRKRSINNSTTTATTSTPAAPQPVTATSSTHRHQHHHHSSEDGSESDYSEDEDEDEDGSASEDDEGEGEGDEGDGATAAGRPRAGSNAQSTSRKASRSGSNKKSRISQACDSCRRRKRKCDGAQPVCSACQKLHLPCLYQTMVKKRGPQPGVVKRLRQEVKQLETEIQREQRQAKLAKFSTLTSGVVPEANVSHNPTMPVGDGSHLGGPATEHEQEDAFATVSLNAAANSRVRNETYLNTYFTLLNNTMFPLLDEKAFYDELKRYEADPSIEVPMSWNLRYAAALSVGSMIYGDVEYAQSAGHVARHAASQLFDQPDPDVLRGMLVLAFHCLSTNQQSRSACYLAVATRMCCLVDISPEIPPLATFMEDMLCSINWWYSGFDVLPIGGYKQIQSDLYPNDKAEYEHLIESQRVRIKDVEEHQLGNTQVNTTMRSMNSRSPTINSTTTSAIPPVSSYASEPSSNHTSSQSADSSSDSSNTPVTAPVTPAVDEDATLRWELLKVMCFTSGMRGEMNKPPSFSLYRCLYILTKSLISPLTVGAIRTLILYFKVVCLKMLATTDEDHRELVHNATLATEAAQTHDTTHCPFYSLCFHVIAQVHMMHRYGSDEEVEELIVKDLDIVDKVSRKWEFGMPMLQNLHARILSAYGPGGRTAHHPALLALIANSREHFNHATVNGQIMTDELDVLSPPDRARASLIFSATQVSNKPAPSIVDTMNNLHEKFGSTLKLTEDELIDMAQIKKGLINGPMPVSNSQGSSSGSERSGLTPDMNVGHKGLAETPEMTTPVPLPQFDSIAFAAATGESPPAMNMVHFDRPDLDELMQFGLIDDAPTPSEVFLPIAKSQHDFNYSQAPSAPAHQQYSGMNSTPVMKPPMYTPSPNTYNPSYPQMQSMSPPIPSYQSTAPTYPTYNSSNLAAKERELRQQLDALIQQQQYQQQQQQQYHQHQQQQLHNHHQQQFSHQTQSMFSPPIQSPPSNGYPIQYPQSSPSHPSLSHLPTSSPSSLPYSHGSYDTMRSYETYSSSGPTSGNLPHPMRSNSNTVPSPQSYAPSQYNNNYGPITYTPSTQATANEEYFNQQFPPTQSPSQHQPLNTTNIPF